MRTFFSGAIALGVTAAIIPLAAASAGASSASPGISERHGIAVSNVRRARPPVHLPAPSTHLRPAIASPGTWSFVGPQPIVNDVNGSSNYGSVSGRVTSIVVDPANASTAYAGSAGGGVWKTTDGGAHWAPTSDAQYTGAIGALGIGPGATGQPSVVYAGTGENNQCGDCQIGFGVLKSTDGGASWSLLGMATFTGLQIGGIAVDSTTSGSTQRVLVGTSNGLYVSTDGGATWTLNASLSAHFTGVSGAVPNVADVKQDPSTPTRFYATVGNDCRTDFGDVMVSNDSGATWASVLKGTSTASGCSARESVGVGTGGTAYAVLTNSNVGALDSIWKTTDGGSTWTKLANQPTDYFTNGGASQGWYDNVTAVDPTNNNRVVFGGIDLIATADGGTTYADIGKVYTGGVVHPDQHAVAFTGANSFYVGDDGGVWTTTDLGGTGTASDWTDRNATLAITQYYGGAALDATHLLGGTQDNGNSGSFAGVAGNPTLPAFQEYEGGDGFYTAIDPSSNTIYTEYFDGQIYQGNRTSQFNNTPAGPCATSTDPACGEPVLFWAPFVADAGNVNHLFAGTDRVYRTTTGGLPAGAGGWTPISPNVTTVASPNSTNCFANDCIASMATAPGGNIVMTGSFYGAVWLSTNAQAASPTFTNITGNLPALNGAHFLGGAWISGVAFNASNPSEAWVTIGTDTTIGRIWHTTNAGAAGGTTWTDITGNYPQYTATSVVGDPNNPGVIYVGGLQGVSVCTSCGGANPSPSWTAAGTSLPNTEVFSLTVSNDKSELLAWTHGRGVWALPLTSGAPAVGLSPASLSFGNQQVRTTSAAVTETVTNTGSATLNISGVSIGGSNPGDFAKGADTCTGAALAPSSTCSVAVSFAPTAGGTRGAQLTFADNAAGSPQSVPLSGKGDSVLLGVVGTDKGLWVDQDGQGYSGLGGQLVAATAVVAVPVANAPPVPLYIGVGTDHNVYVRSSTAFWQPLSSSPVYCIDNVGAAVTGGTLTVACQGSDHALWYVQGAVSSSGLPTLNGWQSLGGVLSAGPAVAPVGGTVTFFVVGSSGGLYSRTVTASYVGLSASCKGHPAAATQGSVSYLACHGSDDALWYSVNSGSGWGPFRSAGGVIVDGPAVAATSTQVTIYVEGSDTAVYHTVIPLGGGAASAYTRDGGSVNFGTAAAGLVAG